MLFRFLGNYTNGHVSITMGGVTFLDRDPADVNDPDLVRRLLNNPEFHAVTAKDAEPKPVKKPAKKKAAK